MLQFAVTTFWEGIQKFNQGHIALSYKSLDENVVSESHVENTLPALPFLARTFSLWNWWSSCLISGLMSCCACLFLPDSILSMPFSEQLTYFQLFHLEPSFLEGGRRKGRKELTVVSHCYVLYTVCNNLEGAFLQTTCLYSKGAKGPEEGLTIIATCALIFSTW